MSDFISKYKVLQKIGEGSFSEVLKCEARTNRELFAAKILNKTFNNTNDVMYCAEIIAMQKLGRHPNVLFMHEYFFEKASGKLIFIFELMDMSMYEFMQVRKRCFPELKVKNYLYQMLKGLDYLHINGLFHRDIKPENLLVKIEKNQQCELIKLGDLGSIRGIYSKPPYTEYISTRWYRSPECLLTMGHYGFKMDIWATGCVFYEMLTKTQTKLTHRRINASMKPLFPGVNEIDQLAKIHNILGTPSPRLLAKLKSKSRNLSNFEKLSGTGLTSLIGGFSADAQSIIKLMLPYDPEARSNARRLLQHRYFNSIRDMERALPVRESGDASNCLVSTAALKANDKSFMSYSMKNIASRSKKKTMFMSKTVDDLNHKAKLKALHRSTIFRNLCKKSSNTNTHKTKTCVRRRMHMKNQSHIK